MPLILGLGNTIRSDDGIGIMVAQELRKADPPLAAEIKEASVAGLSILDEIDGYDRVILIDSIKTGKDKPGSVYKLKPEDFNTTTQLSNSHGIDFFTAIELGKNFGYNIPKRIDIYAIEIEDNATFNDKCNPKVKLSIPKIVKLITEEVQN